MQLLPSYQSIEVRNPVAELPKSDQLTSHLAWDSYGKSAYSRCGLVDTEADDGISKAVPSNLSCTEPAAHLEYMVSFPAAGIVSRKSISDCTNEQH